MICIMYRTGQRNADIMNAGNAETVSLSLQTMKHIPCPDCEQEIDTKRSDRTRSLEMYAGYSGAPSED